MVNDKLIHIFLDHPQEFLSGEQISDTLGCSRTAVWKHIQQLREQGYEFESMPRKGYRLLREPDRLSMHQIVRELKTTRLGRSIYLKGTVSSTQSVAQELASRGEPEGTLVIAEEQTAGRGRMGRSWLSPRGKGIWMSLILKPNIPLQVVPQLTILTAVAVCRALNKQVKVDIGIKWPNDLLIEGKKVCGILLESSGEDERLRHVIAGIGISVNLLQADFPTELLEKSTSLRIADGEPFDRARLICAVLEEFEHLYRLFLEQGFMAVKLLWEALSVTINRRILAESTRGPVEGIALGLDDYGALRIELPTGEIVSVFSGDIQFAIME